MTFEQMVAAIDEIRAATDKPFGVNLRTDAADIDKRVDHLIKVRVPVASRSRRPRARRSSRSSRTPGIVVMPTIGARRHAEKVAAWGVDAVIAKAPRVAATPVSSRRRSCFPQVLDTVDIPVIAAGGFFDGRGLAAALTWGAAGVAMGTRFLLTSDSAVPDHVKAALPAGQAAPTPWSPRRSTARPQRVIRTEVIDRLEKARLLAFPKAAANALRFRKLTGTSMRELVVEGWR